MKTEELKNEGLLREYKIIVPGESIQGKINKEVEEKAKTFKMPGFREGKVPMSIVKKKLEPELMGKYVEKSIEESLESLFEEKNIRPAMQPSVEIENFEPGGELAFKVTFEAFPDVPDFDWASMELDTLKVKVTDKDIEDAHNDIMKNFHNYKNTTANYKAKKNDTVIANVIAKVAGSEEDGNKIEDVNVIIGSETFTPELHDQLIGIKAGDKKTIQTKLPEDFSQEEMAGEEFVLDFDVKEVKEATPITKMDDEAAKSMGMESLEKLNESIKNRIEGEVGGLMRMHAKKVLFDKLESECSFKIPPSMFKADFDSMWENVKKQKEENPEKFDKSEEELKKEYEEVAKRRVKLGLFLAETARKNNVSITNQDLQELIKMQAQMLPGQENQVLEFFSKPENLESVKGPMLEEKTVDFILGKINKKEKEITPNEFKDKYAKELMTS